MALPNKTETSPGKKETKKKKKIQNTLLARGIYALSRNALGKKNGRFMYGKGAKEPTKKESTKEVKIEVPTSKWYPVDCPPKKLLSAKTIRNSKKTVKLRKSITPGTILILLSGRFRGKRVVFLKQLASGTLLVTGPYKINGVPLRRVNQAYVIATSSKIDISGVKLPEINDAYFARIKEKKAGNSEETFFADDSKKAIVSEQRKKDQSIVDSALMKIINGQSLLKEYLNARFSLTPKDRVHEIKF